MTNETRELEAACSTLASNSYIAKLIKNVKDETNLSQSDFELVARIAAQPAPKPITATDDEFKSMIGTLGGHLEKKETHEDRGRLNLQIYKKILQNLPLSTLKLITTEALQTLKWMPEASQLLKMAARHTAPELRLYRRAQTLTKQRKQRLFDETLNNLKNKKLNQDQLQSIDERTAKVAETNGFIIIRLSGEKQYRSPEIIKDHNNDLRIRAEENKKIITHESRCE